jgi:integrase
VNALIVAYYASAEFGALDTATRKTYRSLLDRFRDAYGPLPAAELTAGRLRQILDGMATTPGTARNLRKRRARVYDFGIERELLTHNPVRLVRAPRPTRDGFRAWTEADIARFEAHWPSGSKPRLALALLLYTGQRRSDVVSLGRQHVRDGRISVTQYKGRNRAGGPTRLVIPLHPFLRAEIEAAPAGLTFLLTAYGAPFTRDGFSQWFAEKARQAGLPPRSSPHGLRKAAGRRLAEAGCSEREIMAVLGHKSAREVDTYTASARQETLADAAISRLKA